MREPGLTFDPARETRRVVGFIGQTVENAKAEGVLVGLSGGIDSAVVGALCVRALGKQRVRVLLLPSETTPIEDLEDAITLAESWGVKSDTMEITKVVDAAKSAAGSDGTRLARANIQARVRMMILYYHANSSKYLVAGTGDRTEIEMGFFTKWGDGGVDFLPIAHLFKTQVRTLGDYLGLPRRVVTKPSSPRLWPGHKATDELPADFGELDLFLHWYLDERAGPSLAARKAGVSKSVADKILALRERTAHKRTMPPSLASSNRLISAKD